MKSLSGRKTAAVCLCLCLLSSSTNAWWPATPEPREQYRHLIPMGHDFPGMPRSGAERVTQTTGFAQHPRPLGTLRLRQPPRNRKSTGLYLVPGESVTVTVRTQEGERLSGAQWNGPRLVIGSHEVLPVTPEDRGQGPARAMESLSLEDDLVYDGNRAGGLIHIESWGTGNQTYEITIAGAVRAPWFKLGRDSLAQWQDLIRHEPAPWAELEGRHSILTLPASMIRDLDDPEPVIRVYDQLVQQANAVVGLAEDAGDERDRAPDLPVRLVLDPALSLAGTGSVAARSGYPIKLNPVAFDDPAVWLEPDLPQIHAIVLHELGHNYEPVNALLEPPGAEEAFADLIQYGWQSRQGYWFLGSRTEWPGFKSDLWCTYLPLFGYPLSFYEVFFVNNSYSHDARIWVEGGYVAWMPKHRFMIELVRHLSHDFIAALYHRFRHTPQEALPAKDNAQQKTDFFFELLCEVTQQDLSLFFQSWYLPVSTEAYQRVADKGYEVPLWVLYDRR